MRLRLQRMEFVDRRVKILVAGKRQGKWPMEEKGGARIWETRKRETERDRE